MSVNVLRLLHDGVCGGLAAGGFGVLFNVSFRGLPWCAVAGAAALALRTTALEAGWRLEAASFIAALVIAIVAQLLPPGIPVSRNALQVGACIPLIPGGLAAKAILGLFAVTSPTPVSNETFIISMQSTLRVVFTIGALATGLSIPLLLRSRSTKRS